MYILNSIVEEITKDPDFSPALKPFTDKLLEIEHKNLPQAEKERQYLSILGIEKESNGFFNTLYNRALSFMGLSKPEEYDVLGFLIQKDPNFACRILNLLKAHDVEQSAVIRELSGTFSQVLREAITKGNLELAKSVLQFKYTSNWIGASLLGLALKQGNQEMVNLIKENVKIGGIPVMDVFTPDALQKLMSSPTTDFMALQNNPIEFLNKMPATDLRSAHVLTAMQVNQAYRNYLTRDYRSVTADFDRILEKIEADTFKAMANDFALSGAMPSLVLFEKMHPNSKIEHALTPFDAKFLTTRYGHILGLSDTIAVKSGTNTHELNFEGSMHRISQQELRRLIHNYIGSGKLEGKPEKEYFKQIEEATAFSEQLLNKIIDKYPPEAKNAFYERYKAGKITSIASGWPGHAVNVALHGSYLVYTNRGEGGNKDHKSMIFKIKDPAQITPEYIEKLYSTANQSAEDLHRTLRQVVDFDNPVVTFPSKGQLHGNCSFANCKSAVEPLLFLCAHNAPNGPNLDGLSGVQTERGQYKDFTHFMREQTMLEVAQNSQLAQSPETGAFYLELVKAIISQHHGEKARSSEKSKDEMLRIAQLLQNLPPDMAQALKTDPNQASYINYMLNVAAQTGNVPLTQALLKSEVVRALIDHPALNYAIIKDKSEIIREFIKVPSIRESLLNGLPEFIDNLPRRFHDKLSNLFAIMKEDPAFAPVLSSLMKETDGAVLIALQRAGISDNSGLVVFKQPSQTVNPVDKKAEVQRLETSQSEVQEPEVKSRLRGPA